MSPSVSYTSYDEFYVGSVKMPGVPGGGHIERTSYRLYANYGIQENLALDASVGYANTESTPSQQDEFTDSHLGLSWQALTESASGADFMLRLGVIIAGSYETGFLSAPGDGENGADLMTKIGKTFTSGGVRGDVELGYTIYEGGGVPDGFRLRAGPTIPVGNGLSLDFGGIYFTGIDGIDIMGPGFTGLSDLPKVEEEGLAGEVGLSLGSQYGYYRLSVSQLFDGRNIGRELTIGLFGSFAF